MEAIVRTEGFANGEALFVHSEQVPYSTIKQHLRKAGVMTSVTNDNDARGTVGTTVTVGHSEDFSKRKVEIRAFFSIPCEDDPDILEATYIALTDMAIDAASKALPAGWDALNNALDEIDLER